MSAPACAVVFGSGGQVGSALLQTVLPGWSAKGFDRAAVDITDAEAVRRAIDASGSNLVVNAAGYTAVDKAEAEPERAMAVNRDGAGHIARAAQAAGALLVHLSTDYVFDGAKVGAYREDDAVAPLSVYGRSKTEGEETVRAAGPRHIVLRTARVFSPRAQNFVGTMLRVARDRPSLRVVEDQIGCPTPADAIALAVWAIADRLKGRGTMPAGTFHFAGQPAVSWHGFATAIFAAAAPLGLRPPRLEPVPATTYPTPAARPRNAALDCTRIREAFGIETPDWEKALRPCIEALLQPVASGGVS
jgi:dTDP-4-dehydrorhamnose reductase